MGNDDNNDNNNNNNSKDKGMEKYSGSTDDTDLIVGRVETWFRDVVLGLNLCPFAHRPHREKILTYRVSFSQDDQGVLNDVQDELHVFDKTPAEELDTSIIVVANHLQAFSDYNNFLDWVDFLLVQMNWQGVYQVASFHPNYCFGGVHPDADENLTNRSPYPLLHILRESSLAQAIDSFPNTGTIPEDNIKRVSSLDAEEKARLFPFIFSH